MYVVFEDNDDVPTSRLLKNIDNINFVFTNSNKSIGKYISKIYQTTDEFIVVYIDVVTDREETKKIYNRLVDLYENDERVIIFPIPCIECAMLHLLYNLDLIKKLNKNYISVVRDLLYDFKFQGYSNYNIKYDDTDSLEIYYKKVYKELIVKTCMYNITAINIQKVRFFETDCSCDYSYCKTRLFNLSLLDKAVLLYKSLPFYIVVEKDEKVFKSPLNSEDCICIFNFYKSFYEKMMHVVGNADGTLLDLRFW